MTIVVCRRKEILDAFGNPTSESDKHVVEVVALHLYTYR